jgi:type II secretory pathway pseudopilin PulG
MTGRSRFAGVRRAARLYGQAGLSMVEIVIVLSVITAITGILAPAGLSLVQQARELQVERDGGSLRDSIIKLLVDSNRTTIRLGQGNGPRVDLLVSEGLAPDTDGSGDSRWIRTPDGAGVIDSLDHYLVENTPAGSLANAWPVPTSLDSGGWRGAYLPTVPATDPWGHRYAINVRYLGTRNDVLVLSAGPDGLVQTPYEGSGLLPGGDDRAVLVR